MNYSILGNDSFRHIHIPFTIRILLIDFDKGDTNGLERHMSFWYEYEKMEIEWKNLDSDTISFEEQHLFIKYDIILINIIDHISVKEAKKIRKKISKKVSYLLLFVEDKSLVDELENTLDSPTYLEFEALETGLKEVISSFREDSKSNIEKYNEVKIEDDRVFEQTINFGPNHISMGKKMFRQFADVIDSKYEGMEVSISIEQKGTIVKMVVISPDGDTTTEIKEDLENYKAYLKGEVTAETVVGNDLRRILELESQRDILVAELRSEQRINSVLQRNYEWSERNLDYFKEMFVKALDENRLNGKTIRKLASSNFLFAENLLIQNKLLLKELKKLDKLLIQLPNPSTQSDLNKILEKISKEDKSLLIKIKKHISNVTDGVVASGIYDQLTIWGPIIIDRINKLNNY